MDDKKINILFNENQIRNRIKELGSEITGDYSGEEIYILSLLRGSFIFAADLVRSISLKAKIGFMTTSSYGYNENSTGNVDIISDLKDDISGLNVLIVDDIIDTGITMNCIKKHIEKLGALSVKSCVLLDKPERRKIDIKPDYCCFQIPDVFVVGYGLNYGDYYRNVPYVFNWENRE